MERLLAVSLSFASALAFAAPATPEPAPRLLSVEEAGNPEFVVQWLTETGPKTDQEDARLCFSYGLEAKQSRNWSLAVKAFNESMIRYPGPHALFEYADAVLRMLAQVRAREGFPAWRIRDDMEYFLGFYEASLAANGVTKTLPASEVERIGQHIACIKEYLASPRQQADCQPVTIYFSKRKAGK